MSRFICQCLVKDEQTIADYLRRFELNGLIEAERGLQGTAGLRLLQQSKLRRPQAGTRHAHHALWGPADNSDQRGFVSSIDRYPQGIWLATFSTWQWAEHNYHSYTQDWNPSLSTILFLRAHYQVLDSTHGSEGEPDVARIIGCPYHDHPGVV